MEFDRPWLVVALILGVAAVLGLLWIRRRPAACLGYSDLEAWRTSGGFRSFKVRIAFLPGLLKGAALVLLLLALIDPRLLKPVPRTAATPPPATSEDKVNEQLDLPTEGIALYLVLDRSSSMLQELSGDRERQSRLQALKRMTQQFIRERSSDLIGLIAFARTAQVLAPLTLDHQVLLSELSKLTCAKYRTEDGTAIGYAVFKTVNLIAATQHFAKMEQERHKPAYEIKSTAMILVTDGLQHTNPLDSGHELRTMDLEKACARAAELGVKVYIVNIEPMVRYTQFAAARKSFETAAELTGGKFFIGDSAEGLREIYREIDRLERSGLPQKRTVRAEIKRKRLMDGNRQWDAHSFSGALMLAALLLLWTATGLESTILRRVP